MLQHDFFCENECKNTTSFDMLLLNFAISMSLKFKDEIDSATFDNLMEEDANVVYELSCLASNIKKEVVGVLDFFFPF